MRFGGVLVMMSSDRAMSTIITTIGEPRADEHHRPRDHPAEDAAGTGEHLHAVARDRLAAEDVAEPGDRDQEDAEADADAGVVVH